MTKVPSVSLKALLCIQSIIKTDALTVSQLFITYKYFGQSMQSNIDVLAAAQGFLAIEPLISLFVTNAFQQTAFRH